MLTKWGLSNFKSIKNANIELAPLTILAGTNSSGKSSLIQSILLIAQTLRNHLSPQEELILNGSLVQLGTIEDIKFSGDGIGISFSWENGNQLNKLGIISNEEKEIMPKICENQKNEIPLFIDYDLKFFKSKGQPKIQYSKLYVNDRLLISAEKDNPNEKDYNYNSYPELLKELEEIGEIEKKSVALHHFIPEEVKITYKNEFSPKEIETKANDFIDYFFAEFSKLFSENILDFNENDASQKISAGEAGLELADKINKKFPNLVSLDTFVFLNKMLNNIGNRLLLLPEDENDMPIEIKKIITGSDNDKDIIINIYKHFFNDYRNELFERIKIDAIAINENTVSKENNEKLFLVYVAKRDIVGYFSRALKYIGPLRYRNPIYPLRSSDDPQDVGISGEYLASVINSSSDDTIRCIHPKENDILICNKSEIKEEKFNTVLKRWLKYLGISDDIESNPLGNLGYELKINKCNMTQVGTGISQVLPILTICLLANYDSTIIIEQPELHLHPKMQTKLADFFVAMSQSGRQIIIETHSEHFINALRNNIVKTHPPNDEKLAEDAKIYFVEKGEDGSEFRSITINKYAAISDWPEDFLDESSKTADEIIKAASQKWKQEKGHK